MDIISVIKEKNKTIQDVADALGKSRITIAKTIAGNPTVDTLRSLAKVLDCDIEDFFKDECIHNRQERAPILTCPKCGAKLNITINFED